jgi:hypothetical protein
MNSGKGWISLFSFLFLMLSAMACSQQSGSGFLRKEFLEYKSVAILRFERDDSGEVSEAFANNFRERFPQISILSGKVFLDNFRKETFNPNQLDDVTRLKIGRTIGAQALITGSIHSPSISSWFLQVKIIDAKTGRMMGRSTVTFYSLMPTDIREATRLAVEKLSMR